jgi:hypothetical protein
VEPRKEENYVFKMSVGNMTGPDYLKGMDTEGKIQLY